MKIIFIYSNVIYNKRFLHSDIYFKWHQRTLQHYYILYVKKKLQINIKMNIISVSYLKKYIRIAIHTKKYEKNNII